MNKIQLIVSGCLVLLASTVVNADRAADEKAIRKALGGVEATSIEPAPLPGLYEVVVGAHVIYMSADGRYMLQGELLDVLKRESLTEPRRRQAQLDTVERVSEDKMIVFKPEKVKHTITVFTDIDCGYCRKLHKELNQFMDAGIKVRYMLFPRAGVGSDSYNKAVAVWCADDRNQALTDAKNNKPIPMKTCDNPIDEHMQLVNELGIRGTPFIILEDGRTQPGYVTAQHLARLFAQPGS